jgi:UDP-glucose 4-epimerase
MLLLADSRQAEGNVFNAGTDEEVTVLELAKRIKRLCHSDSAIELVPYEEVYGQSFEDMRRRVPDLKKIRRFVGYRPEVTLERLLETTIRDHCERVGVPCPIEVSAA